MFGTFKRKRALQARVDELEDRLRDLSRSVDRLRGSDYGGSENSLLVARRVADRAHQKIDALAGALGMKRINVEAVPACLKYEPIDPQEEANELAQSV